MHLKYISHAAVFYYLFAGFLPPQLAAQDFDLRREVAPFPVRDLSGTPYTFPFLGGFNHPRPQFVDIDGDGDLDLFVQEEINALNYFENVGLPGAPEWAFRSAKFSDLPVGDWFVFVDLDSDGDADLLSDGREGWIRVYRNTATAGPPTFMIATLQLRDAAGEAILAGEGSLFDLADIDCDGDPDLFLNDRNGMIVFYENTGPAGALPPAFVRREGKFENILAPPTGTIVPQSGPTPSRHGASGLAFVDIDGDSDQDLFWGDISQPSLLFRENAGTCAAPEYAAPLTAYPPLHPISTGGFNLPRFADIDNDGDPDLFVTVLNEGTSDLIENFYHYENIGTAVEPHFALRSRRFLSSLDIGERSVVALADLDADGDQDMLLANEADPATPHDSRFYYFQNQGTPRSPDFQLVSDNFIRHNLGLACAPAFADIDADGDFDLFVGEWDGNINFFENIGSPSVPIFRLKNTRFAGINTGFGSIPSFVDIDADGDLDLFAGRYKSTIYHYENIGSAIAAKYQLRSTIYVDLDFGTYADPTFIDIDGDADPDMFVGNGDGYCWLFPNRGTPAQPRIDPNSSFELRTMKKASPRFADIDADGDLDLFVGGAGGGLHYFENRDVTTAVRPALQEEILPQRPALLRSYPNPMRRSTQISLHIPEGAGTLDRGAVLIVYDVLGRKIREWRLRAQHSSGIESLAWDGTDYRGQAVASGKYFLKIRQAGKILAEHTVTVLR